MSLSLRVAHRHRLAAFIPDKFWRDQKAKLKAILTKPIEARMGVAGARWALEDSLRNFYKNFAVSLTDLDLGEAERTVRDRTENVLHVIDKVVESLVKFEREIESVPWPAKTPEEELAWAIAMEVKDMFEEKVKTPLHAMKAFWQVDRRLITNLAKRLMKKATLDEFDALRDQIEHSEDFGRPSAKVKYEFYERVGLKAQARKLVSFEKIKYDPIKWMDFLREVLVANYAGEAGERLHARNFDLHGVKVIVDDATVDNTQLGLYVRYLDKAYQALRSKGLSKVWYGTFFIKCESCGGVNQYGAELGVGGNYPIGPDVVNIFVRPSSFIVELVAHELGHRYWFKQMTQGQRARFESFVRIQKRPKPTPLPPRLVDDKVAKDAKAKVDRVIGELQRAVAQFKTAMLKAKRISQGIQKNTEAFITPAISTFSREYLDAVRTEVVPFDAATKGLFNDLLEVKKKLRNRLWDADTDLKRLIMSEPEPTEPVNLDTYWPGVLRKHLPGWLEATGQLIEEARTVAYIYVDGVIHAHNEHEQSGAANDERLKEWQQMEDADPRKVKPVSDYGGKHIDEAFAEAFAYYVIEKDMNQDQIESFRAVLKTAAERVAARVHEKV